MTRIWRIKRTKRVLPSRPCGFKEYGNPGIMLYFSGFFGNFVPSFSMRFSSFATLRSTFFISSASGQRRFLAYVNHHSGQQGNRHNGLKGYCQPLVSPLLLIRSFCWRQQNDTERFHQRSRKHSWLCRHFTWRSYSLSCIFCAPKDFVRFWMRFTGWLTRWPCRLSSGNELLSSLF